MILEFPDEVQIRSSMSTREQVNRTNPIVRLAVLSNRKRPFALMSESFVSSKKVDS